MATVALLTALVVRCSLYNSNNKWPAGRPTDGNNDKTAPIGVSRQATLATSSTTSYFHLASDQPVWLFTVVVVVVERLVCYKRTQQLCDSHSVSEDEQQVEERFVHFLVLPPPTTTSQIVMLQTSE